MNRKQKRELADRAAEELRQEDGTGLRMDVMTSRRLLVSSDATPWLKVIAFLALLDMVLDLLGWLG